MKWPFPVLGWRQLREWRAMRAFRNQRATWYEDVARALGDGIAIADYLKKSIQREQQHGSHQVAWVLRIVLGRLPSMPLNEALAGIIPDAERMILAAAERAGALTSNLRRLADSATRIRRMPKDGAYRLVRPARPGRYQRLHPVVHRHHDDADNRGNHSPREVDGLSRGATRPVRHHGELWPALDRPDRRLFRIRGTPNPTLDRGAQAGRR